MQSVDASDSGKTGVRDAAALTGRKFPLASCVMTTIVVDNIVFVEVNSMVVPGAVVVLTIVSNEVMMTVMDSGAVVVSVTVTTTPDPSTVAVAVPV